jgi:hypothetical protein
MRSYIYQSLMSIRNIFSRHSTWLLFCMLILRLIGAGEKFTLLSGAGEKSSEAREKAVLSKFGNFN